MLRDFLACFSARLFSLSVHAGLAILLVWHHVETYTLYGVLSTHGFWHEILVHKGLKINVSWRPSVNFSGHEPRASNSTIVTFLELLGLSYFTQGKPCFLRFKNPKNSQLLLSKIKEYQPIHLLSQTLDPPPLYRCP